MLYRVVFTFRAVNVQGLTPRIPKMEFDLRCLPFKSYFSDCISIALVMLTIHLSLRNPHLLFILNLLAPLSFFIFAVYYEQHLGSDTLYFLNC